MSSPQRALEGVFVLPFAQSAPGHGMLPVNAYLFTGASPVLVDTGLAANRDELLPALWSLVDPDDLAAVFLTHEDADHAGNLGPLLDAARRCRLVTNYVTVSKLLERDDVPLDRVSVVNHGDRVPGTDRDLRVLRPIVYDSPGSIGLRDADTGAVLTVDAFGTYLPEMVASLDEVEDRQIVKGLTDFNRMNHPWISVVDRSPFADALEDLAGLDAAGLLSSHGVLPGGKSDLLMEAMMAVPSEPPYVPPDQAVFEELRPEMGS